MNRIQKYASFVKLEHTLFSVPLLFAGALLAERAWPSLRVLFLVLVGGASARVVALALNRIIDREIDRLNPRTQERHLAAGTMRLYEAWLGAFVALVFYLLSAWSLSDFCLRISWIPLLAFAMYPYFKRFTKWTHVGLGLVWSLVPLAGFFAVGSTLKGIGPVIFLAIFSVFWLAGFDIIYATADEDFDRETGVHSLPSAWGAERALRMAGIFHIVAFATLVALYVIWLSGPLTVLLLGIIGVLLFLEQKYSRYIDLAFFQINVYVGFAVFFFILSGIKGT